jgi:hypothetical protein
MIGLQHRWRSIEELRFKTFRRASREELKLDVNPGVARETRSPPRLFYFTPSA